MGIDLSERMLERARHDTGSPAIEYLRADLDDVRLPTGAFELDRPPFLLVAARRR